MPSTIAAQPPSFLARFVQEREHELGVIRTYAETAEREERDLRPEEQETITRSRERIAAIDSQLELLAVNFELDEEVGERISTISRASAGPAVEYRSVGHFLFDLLNEKSDPEARDRLSRFRRVHERAAPHQTTVEAAGLVPDPIVGQVVDFIDGRRPFVSYVGTMSAPAPVFHRPVLTDADSTSNAQASEKTELGSALITVTRADVSMDTIGRYANVSVQLEGYSTPSALTVITNALARSYARATEFIAVAAVLTSTGTIDFDIATADGEAMVGSIYAAARKYYDEMGELPTYLLVGPDGWEYLGSLVDTTKRPLLPFLSPSNALGQLGADSFDTNPLGLDLIVSYAMTAGSMVVGGRESQEFYERIWPNLTAVEPSVAGRQIAVAGDFGVFRPNADAPVVLKNLP